MIRKYQPDIIFTHYWLDYMAHKAMATIVTEAWWQASWEASLELGKPWKEGMIFLASCICDLKLEAVEWTRQWIQKVGDEILK